MELIDSHCHLFHYTGPKAYKTVDQILAEAKAVNVSQLITIGVDVETSIDCQKIAHRFHEIIFTAGVHPHEAKLAADGYLDQLRKIHQDPKCVAVGEIGLDYYYDHSPPEIQKRVLNEQLELALELNKPIVIHSRDAEPDLLESLRRYAPKVKNYSPGVIHCFTGTRPFAEECIDLGFYISFSGILTFKTSDELRAIARDLPNEKLLVETDAPYLAPVPLRGKKCEPAMVRYTAQALAELRGISLEELSQITYQNTKKLFG